MNWKRKYKLANHIHNIKRRFYKYVTVLHLKVVVVIFIKIVGVVIVVVLIFIHLRNLRDPFFVNMVNS